jgi:photosystem II stability/assembly factor-like uncharacterized protein
MFSSILRALSIVTLATSLWAARPGDFHVIGPGGGGAMFNPTISPHDKNTVLVSCDMTGAYITHDGGQSWRMFNLRGTVRFFTFDPIDPKTMYAKVTGLWRSTDGGGTWRLVYPSPAAVRGVRMDSDHADESIVADPDPLGDITALAIDPADSRTLYVTAASTRQAALFVSQDFGKTWSREASLPETAHHIWVDSRSPRASRTLYISGTNSTTVRVNGEFRHFPTPASWISVSMGFGPDPLLYATSKDGPFVSRDAGKSWQKCSLPGTGARVLAVATSVHHPQTAYLSYNHLNLEGHTWMGVAKTYDAGRTWQLLWKEDAQPAANIHDAWITQRFGTGWGENPQMLGVAEQDPNLCYGTDFGRTMQTTDGGKSWNAVYSRKIPGGEWTSTGLDVTTNYGFHFDPFNRKRQFIDYTDIGLFRSEDGGRSWTSSTQGVPRRWVNTTYWIEFDPKRPGLMWSVNSGTHDLPRPKMWRHNSVLNYRGGVCRSEDGGKTWVKSNDGMPETAPTDILLDPASPVNARVLYVAASGRGVYKSNDNGKTWTQKNNGITQKEPFAWRLARASDGALYVVLARRSEDGSIGNDGDGAIYKSTDNAESWRPVALPAGVNGPNSLAVDPQSPNRLYLAAWARAKGMHGEGGGIYISNDGGKSWKGVLDRDQHVYDVTIDPRNAKHLYASGFESSAWQSKDRGEHWTRIPGFNFKWGHRVIPDPASQDKVYITTFGGSVWHGSVNGKAVPLDILTPALDPGR